MEPQPQPSPSEQALGEELMQAIQAKVSLRAQVIDVLRQLAAAQAKIKELEKAAPVPDQNAPT